MNLIRKEFSQQKLNPIMAMWNTLSVNRVLLWWFLSCSNSNANAMANVPRTLKQFIECVKTFKFNLSIKQQWRKECDGGEVPFSEAHEESDKVDHFMFAIRFPRLNKILNDFQEMVFDVYTVKPIVSSRDFWVSSTLPPGKRWMFNRAQMQNDEQRKNPELFKFPCNLIKTTFSIRTERITFSLQLETPFILLSFYYVSPLPLFPFHFFKFAFHFCDPFSHWNKNNSSPNLASKSLARRHNFQPCLLLSIWFSIQRCGLSHLH